MGNITKGTSHDHTRKHASIKMRTKINMPQPYGGQML